MMKNARPAIDAKPSALDSVDSTAQLQLFKGPRKPAPIPPERGCKAWLALLDMVQQGEITQIDWLNTGRGWRLAAAIKELKYLGWSIVAEWVQPASCQNPIKQYRLPTNYKRTATILLKKEVLA